MQKTTLLIPGAAYYLQNHATSMFLTGSTGTGNGVKGQALNDSNAAAQQWLLDVYKDSDNVVVYSFVQKGNNARLYLVGTTVEQLVITTLNDAAGWTLTKQSNNTFSVVNYNSSTKSLMQDTHKSTITVGSSNAIADNEKWQLYLADIEVTGTLSHIEYGAVSIPATQKTMIDSGTIVNSNASATVEAGVNISKNISSTFSWSLNESLTLGISDTLTLEGEVGIPLVAEGKVTNATTLTASTTIGSSQTWTTTEGVTFTANMNISVPPNSRATYNAYVNMASNITSSFTMYVKIKAKSTTRNIELTGQQLKTLLEDNGYKGMSSVSVGKNSVKIGLTGSFTGSYGINMEVDVN
ncbi:MAG: hypothetical protein ACKVTZ_21840 [Bacteroidia bacterium]